MTVKLLMRGVSLVLLATPVAYADPGEGWNGFHHDMMWGVGMFGGFTMLLFWGVLLALVVLVVRWLSKSSGESINTQSALDILKERYAKGEIDEDEYRKRKSTLEQ